MSLLSRIKHWFVGSPDAEVAKPAHEAHASRHDRREAGRERHHTTGEPAWDKRDRVDEGAEDTRNPDAAPEILGGG
jgi:hypothetical protein